MTPFDIVNDLLHKKELPFDDKAYVPFIINKAVGNHVDCILPANTMNKNHHLPKHLQHQYYLNIITPMRRFAKWVKKLKDDDVEIVMEYYQFSRQKAKEALSLLTKEQLVQIKRIMRGKDD